MTESEKKTWTFNLSEAALELFRLSLRVNAETPLAVFFDFSGHVRKIGVRVGKSKKDYHEEIYNDNWIDVAPEEDWEERDFEREMQKIRRVKHFFIAWLEKAQEPECAS